MAAVIYHFTELRPDESERLVHWLQDHRGVTEAIADPQAKTITVTFDPTLTVDLELQAGLKERGGEITSAEGVSAGDVSPTTGEAQEQTWVDEQMLSAQRKAELD